jgi:hypothetical protein
MSLTLNANEARRADNFSSIIRETGKYVGTITRAEKLLSGQGTHGVGLSFKAEDGSTASYLDVYTQKATGEPLWGHNIIQALLCCLGLRTADEGEITFDKWDKSVREMVKAKAPGYPALMGKTIGFVLQKELQSHYQTGADQERMNLVRVFRASDGMTASEILDKKTKAEKIDALMAMLPKVKDSRKKGAAPVAVPASTGGTDPAFDDDIPF